MALQEEDNFLDTIRAKGFAKDKTIDALRSLRPMSISELSEKIESHLNSYMDQQQTQPFANFII